MHLLPFEAACLDLRAREMFPAAGVRGNDIPIRFMYHTMRPLGVPCINSVRSRTVHGQHHSHKCPAAAVCGRGRRPRLCALFVIVTAVEKIQTSEESALKMEGILVDGRHLRPLDRRRVAVACCARNSGLDGSAHQFCSAPKFTPK